MLNKFIEPTIKRKIIITEAIYTNPGVTLDQLADLTKINTPSCRRILKELINDSQLILLEQNKHYYIPQDQDLVTYHANLYQQSPFLTFLNFVLNNHNQNISVTNISFALNRSASSVYEIRRFVKKVLKHFDLQLDKNIVTGNELNHRLLIALLITKYQFPPLTDDINKHLLTQLIQNQFQGVNLFPKDYEFLLTLISLGFNRYKYNGGLPDLDIINNFKSTQFMNRINYIINEYHSQIRFANRLSPLDYQYFTYIFLIVSPFIYSAELYQIILKFPNYRQLHAQLTAFNPLGDFLSSSSVKSLITDIFSYTFIDNFYFNNNSIYEEIKTLNAPLSPYLLKWTKKLLTPVLKRHRDDYFIHKNALIIQSLLINQFDYQLDIMIASNNIALINNLKLIIQQLPTPSFNLISNFSFQPTPANSQHDLVIITDSQSNFSTHQVSNYLPPKIKILQINQADLLPFKNQLATIYDQKKTAAFKAKINHLTT